MKRLIQLFAMLAVFVAPAAAAQQEVPLRQVFTSTTQEFMGPQTSPDGRWIVMRAWNADSGASIWIVRANSGAPVRLTTDGFEDRAPQWFASGDRIAFITNRFNRNGNRNFYLAVLTIDPATGRAIGVPRQVTSEPIARGGASSSDGRWLTYVSTGNPAYVKVVPSNGGAARTLARTENNFGLPVFAGASNDIYYQERVGGPSRWTFTLKRVALSGNGGAQLVATKDHPMRILPADPRFIIHEVFFDPQRYELRSLSGELVAAITYPRYMRSPTYMGDGWGIMGVMQDWQATVRVIGIDGGEPRTLVSGDKYWPEAWMSDGSGVIADRTSRDGLLFEVITLQGKVTHTVRLPAGATQSGWRSSTGPWMSYRVRLPSQGDPNVEALHAVNVLTNERRELSRSALRVPIRGRGGSEQDQARWVYAQRSSAGTGELRAVDPSTGASELLMRLPDELLHPALRIGVHGQRVAYVQSRGDSLDLMLVEGRDGAPRRLTTLAGGDRTIHWNWSGTHIVVNGWMPGNNRHWGAFIVPIAAGAPVRQVDLGQESGCDQFLWTPDDSHILMLCYRSLGRIMKLRVRDGQLSPVLTGDMPQQVWEYYLSPDGRQIVYPVQQPTGSTFHTASFRELIQRRR